MEKSANRNTNADVIKGIAILLVVMGHTMTGCTANSQNTFFYNVIWSLQMPLFFLISGYVTRYSAPISDIKLLKKYICKRTLGYILPWLVWTFIIRGLILGNNLFLNIKHLLYNMDSGYWFLFSLWTICIIYGISCYISEKMTSSVLKVVINIAVYLLGMFLLACVALVTDISFLCIKLTLYYMPFFYAGVLFGKYQDRIFSFKNSYKAIEAVTAIMAFLYITLLLKFNFFDMSENLFGIVIRALASIAGCCFISFAASSLRPNGFVSSLLQYFGKRSLEIYLIHYVFLSIFKVSPMPRFSSLQGFILFVADFSLTLIITSLMAYLLNTNSVLSFLLFGRRKK